MKKIIIVMILMLNSLCFANWQVKDRLDSFNEKTGTKEMRYKFNNGGYAEVYKGKELIRVPNSLFEFGDDIHVIAIHANKKLSVDRGITWIRIKFDSGYFLPTAFRVSKDLKTVYISANSIMGGEYSDEILKHMKDDNIMKISLEDEGGHNILKTIKLKGFTSAYKKLDIK